jgi:hypothetical protein
LERGAKLALVVLRLGPPRSFVAGGLFSLLIVALGLDLLLVAGLIHPH